ncbi:hypothetical protein FRX31_032170 [Thalictrum thalictroides]|uniref:Uncharacterized protein n=1 Tax=Thalictrum thalictroides TaxID=46969 RepID=A0A7J6V009_THATH|nr:hypothetical protein FRX31_032170 [Thalictrum thalictroides]
MDINEDERAYNEQLRESIAETFQRQSEVDPSMMTRQRIDIDGDSQSNYGVQYSTYANQHNERIAPSTEFMKWGKNGIRSQPRCDTGSSSMDPNRKNLTHVRIHPRRITVNDDEFEICVALIPSDEQTLPSLENPYILRPSTCSVKSLRQYVADQTSIKLKEIDLSLVPAPIFPTSGSMPVYDPTTGYLQLLQSQDTLGALHRCYNPDDALVFVYENKLLKKGKSSRT